MERLDFSDASSYNSIEASIHLNRYLSAKKFITGKRVLDVACGEGYGTFLLKKWGAFEVTGVDISEEALAVAEHKFSGKGISFLKHTAEELPFEDNSFDVVVSYETVEHLDHPEKFLAEIKRVVKNDGTVIVSCPNDPYYYKNDDVYNPYHKRKYSWYDFREMSRKYLGNDVVWYFGFATNGFMTISENKTILPENVDISKIPMEQMMKYDEICSACSVSPDRYINHWNANYYLGVWGNRNEENIETIVSFPRETFIEPDDPIFADVTAWTKQWNEEKEELTKNSQKLNEAISYEQNINKELALKYEAEQQTNAELMSKYEAEKQTNAELTLKYEAVQAEKKQLEELFEAEKQANVEFTSKYEKIENEKIELKSKNDDLTEEIRVTNIQERRTSALLEVANVEKTQLWERINHYEQIIHEKDETIANRESEIANKESEIANKEREIADKENAIMEIGHQGAELQIKVDEFERYKRSISYKLMQPVRKVWDVLRFWKKS